MKPRHFLLIAILLFPVSVKSQPLPTKQEQYEFLKWYLTYKKFEALADSTINFNFDLKHHYSLGSGTVRDLKLRPATISYMKRQDIYDKQALDTANFPRYKWVIVGYRNYISLPIFSPNKKTALIRWSAMCGDPCGETRIEAYVKTRSGKWRASKIPLAIETNTP